MPPVNWKTADAETLRCNGGEMSTRPQVKLFDPREVSTCRFGVLKPLFWLAAVVLPILTLTTAALAGDHDRTYVGAECRPTGDLATNPTGLGGPGTAGNGTMFNTSQTKQIWICPVVRDQMDTDAVEFARVTVIENGTDKIDCTFESRGPDGLNPNSSLPNKKDISQPNPPQLIVLYSYGSGEDDVLTPAKDGYYYFKCEIPGMRDPKFPSGVVTYKATEKD